MDLQGQKVEKEHPNQGQMEGVQRESSEAVSARQCLKLRPSKRDTAMVYGSHRSAADPSRTVSDQNSPSSVVTT